MESSITLDKLKFQMDSSSKQGKSLGRKKSVKPICQDLLPEHGYLLDTMLSASPKELHFNLMHDESPDPLKDPKNGTP